MKPKNVRCAVKDCKNYACAMIDRTFVCKRHFYSIKRNKKEIEKKNEHRR